MRFLWVYCCYVISRREECTDGSSFGIMYTCSIGWSASVSCGNLWPESIFSISGFTACTVDCLVWTPFGWTQPFISLCAAVGLSVVLAHPHSRSRIYPHCCKLPLASFSGLVLVCFFLPFCLWGFSGSLLGSKRYSFGYIYSFLFFSFSLHVL